MSYQVWCAVVCHRMEMLSSTDHTDSIRYIGHSAGQRHCVCSALGAMLWDGAGECQNARYIIFHVRKHTTYLSWIGRTMQHILRDIRVSWCSHISNTPSTISRDTAFPRDILPGMFLVNWWSVFSGCCLFRPRSIAMLSEEGHSNRHRPSSHSHPCPQSPHTPPHTLENEHVAVTLRATYVTHMTIAITYDGCSLE